MLEALNNASCGQRCVVGSGGKSVGASMFSKLPVWDMSLIRKCHDWTIEMHAVAWQAAIALHDI